MSAGNFYSKYITTNFKLVMVNTKSERLFSWPHFFSGQKITKAYHFLFNSLKSFLGNILCIMLLDVVSEGHTL